MSQMMQDWPGHQNQTLMLLTALKLRQRGAGCTGSQVQAASAHAQSEDDSHYSSDSEREG